MTSIYIHNQAIISVIFDTAPSINIYNSSFCQIVNPRHDLFFKEIKWSSERYYIWKDKHMQHEDHGRHSLFTKEEYQGQGYGTLWQWTNSKSFTFSTFVSMILRPIHHEIFEYIWHIWTIKHSKLVNIIYKLRINCCSTGVSIKQRGASARQMASQWEV